MLIKVNCGRFVRVFEIQTDREEWSTDASSLYVSPSQDQKDCSSPDNAAGERVLTKDGIQRIGERHCRFNCPSLCLEDIKEEWHHQTHSLTNICLC